MLSWFRQASPLCQWAAAGLLNQGGPDPHYRLHTTRLIPNPRFCSQTNDQPRLCFPYFHREKTSCSDKLTV
jgi:hypothetical protein